MKYMLDTNICIYIMKQHPESVLKKFTQLNPGDVCISSITLAELQYGVEKSHHRQKNKSALLEFLMPLEILSFDEEAAEHYGHIRATLEKTGELIGSLDTMIAAHAQSQGFILVTNNKKEFNRISNLKIEDWAQRK